MKQGLVSARLSEQLRLHFGDPDWFSDEAELVDKTRQLELELDESEKMITKLKRRAHKKGLSDRIETLVCQPISLCLENFKEKIDFALAANIIHEVHDSGTFFSELSETLKPTGKCLVVEPKGHVSKKDFELSVSSAKQHGFIVNDNPHLARSYAVLLEKNRQN